MSKKRIGRREGDTDRQDGKRIQRVVSNRHSALTHERSNRHLIEEYG